MGLRSGQSDLGHTVGDLFNALFAHARAFSTALGSGLDAGGLVGLLRILLGLGGGFLSSNLGGLLSLLGPLGLRSTKHLPPLVGLLGVNTREQVRGLADLVAGLERGRLPAVLEAIQRGNQQDGRIQLLQDRLGGGRHVRAEHGGQQVDQVQHGTHDCRGALGLVGNERVVQAVSLDQTVANFSNSHGGLDTGTEVDALHLLDVLAGEGGDFLQVGFELLRYRELGNHAAIGSSDKLDDTVNQVSQLGQQFAVVGVDEWAPFELCITSLRAVLEQVVSPHVCRNASVLGVGSEHTDATRLTELTTLVVQVFCGTQVVVHSPGVPSTDLGSREDNTVERHIVLTNELVQLHFLRVAPPELPVIGVIGGNRRVANASLEPHVQHFVFEVIQRDGNTPLEITGDATVLQSFL